MNIYIILGTAVFIVVLLIYYIIRTFNELVKRRNRVNTQWAQVDVQLTRRADLIPNLVEVVKAYALHEKEIFQKFADARNVLSKAHSPEQTMKANELLSSQLPGLFAIAENYPDLTADSNFISLQSKLKDTEDKLAYARQFYNDAALLYKNKLQQFPSNVFAEMFNFEDMPYYIANKDEKDKIKIGF